MMQRKDDTVAYYYCIFLVVKHIKKCRKKEGDKSPCCDVVLAWIFNIKYFWKTLNNIKTSFVVQVWPTF
jgi:hypothetical protein